SEDSVRIRDEHDLDPIDLWPPARMAFEGRRFYERTGFPVHHAVRAQPQELPRPVWVRQESLYGFIREVRFQELSGKRREVLISPGHVSSIGVGSRPMDCECPGVGSFDPLDAVKGRLERQANIRGPVHSETEH